MINGTTSALHSKEMLWPGTYGIELAIYDAHGLSCPAPETFSVDVCDCVESSYCGAKAATLEDRSMEFGGVAVGLMIMAGCMLLLGAVLLITCRSGHGPEEFSAIPFFTEDHLMVYHTEGQGEDKHVPLLSSPVSTSPVAISQSIGPGLIHAKSIRTINQANMTSAYTDLNGYETGGGRFEGGDHFESLGGYRKSSFGELRESQRAILTRDNVDVVLDFALPDVILHEYYSQKASCTAMKRNARDSLLVYGYEGCGSPAGSVGCCSSLASDDDLHFLNDLELKFKTLAEICAPPKPPPQTPAKPPTPTTSPPKSPPSVQVHHPPTASVPPIISKEMVLQAKSNQTMDSKLSTIQEQHVVHNQAISTAHKSTSLQALHEDASIQRKHDHQATNILHSSTVSPQSVTIAPPLGQTILLQQQPMYQQQPIYYITSPVLQPPPAPVFQPMPYMQVQPQIKNTMLFAEAHAPSLQGLVLLPNAYGSTEHIVHSGNATGGAYGFLAMGGRRFSSVVEMNQHVEAGKGRRMSEGWVSSEVLSNGVLAHSGKVQTMAAAGYRGETGSRKSRRRLMSMEEQYENSAVTEGHSVIEKSGKKVQKGAKVKTENKTSH